MGMIFIEFHKALTNYKLAVQAVEEILEEKMVLFQRTQPQSPTKDTERVDGGQPKNKQEEYVIKLEEKRIRERLELAKELMTDRWMLLEQKELELRHSKNVKDIIYCRKILDGLDVADIATELNYSESHVYRIVSNIEKMIGNDRK